MPSSLKLCWSYSILYPNGSYVFPIVSYVSYAIISHVYHSFLCFSCFSYVFPIVSYAIISHVYYSFPCFSYSFHWFPIVSYAIISHVYYSFLCFSYSFHWFPIVSYAIISHVSYSFLCFSGLNPCFWRVPISPFSSLPTSPSDVTIEFGVQGPELAVGTWKTDFEPNMGILMGNHGFYHQI